MCDPVKDLHLIRHIGTAGPDAHPCPVGEERTSRSPKQVSVFLEALAGRLPPSPIFFRLSLSRSPSHPPSSLGLMMLASLFNSSSFLISSLRSRPVTSPPWPAPCVGRGARPEELASPTFLWASRLSLASRSLLLPSPLSPPGRRRPRPSPSFVSFKMLRMQSRGFPCLSSFCHGASALYPVGEFAVQWLSFSVVVAVVAVVVALHCSSAGLLGRATVLPPPLEPAPPHFLLQPGNSILHNVGELDIDLESGRRLPIRPTVTSAHCLFRGPDRP